MATDINKLLKQGKAMDAVLKQNPVVKKDRLAMIDAANAKLRARPSPTVATQSRTQAAVSEVEELSAPKSIPSANPKEPYAGRASTDPTVKGDTDFWKPKNASPSPVVKTQGKKAAQMLRNNPSQSAMGRREMQLKGGTVRGSTPISKAEGAGRVFVQTQRYGARPEDLTRRGATTVAPTPEAPAVQQAARRQQRANPPAVAQAQAAQPSAQTRGANLVQQATQQRRGVQSAPQLRPGVRVDAQIGRVQSPSGIGGRGTALTPTRGVSAPFTGVSNPITPPAVASPATPARARTQRAPRQRATTPPAATPAAASPSPQPTAAPARPARAPRARPARTARPAGPAPAAPAAAARPAAAAPVRPAAVPRPAAPMGVARFYGGSVALGLGIGAGQGLVYEYARSRERKNNR